MQWAGFTDAEGLKPNAVLSLEVPRKAAGAGLPALAEGDVLYLQRPNMGSLRTEVIAACQGWAVIRGSDNTRWRIRHRRAGAPADWTVEGIEP
jgi:hypothetical protein